MVKAVIVDKNCNKKESALNYDSSEFYKKCNYRNDNNFDVRHTWEFKEQGETYYISVFAKDKGRSNSENKYDLPPPIDSDLYYGSLLIIKTFTNENFEKDNNLSKFCSGTLNWAFIPSTDIYVRPKTLRFLNFKYSSSLTSSGFLSSVYL